MLMLIAVFVKSVSFWESGNRETSKRNYLEAMIKAKKSCEM